LVVGVRFEPARLARDNLRVAYELVIPQRRRRLRPSASEASKAPTMVEELREGHAS